MLHTQYTAGGSSLGPRRKLSLIQLTLIFATFTRVVIRGNFLGIAFEKVLFRERNQWFPRKFPNKTSNFIGANTIEEI